MHKYLVIQGARFGDLLQTARLIKSLTRTGETEIALDSGLQPLSHIIYPDIKSHAIKMHGSIDHENLAENEKIFRFLKAARYEAVINCNFSPLSSSIARLFPAGQVFGYRPAFNSEGGSQLSPWLRLIFRITASRSFNPLNLVDIWGFFGERPISPKAVNPKAAALAGPLGVAVAGTLEQRSLPVQVLAKIIDIYNNIMQPPAIKLFGTDKEMQKARKLMRKLSPPALAKTINLCGKTDWQALHEEMKDLGLMLSPDTGLMHMAASMGIQVMAFFLSSALCHETGPYGQGHVIWQAMPACAPCLENSACAHGLKCQQVFARPEFYRLFAKYLLGERLPEFPTDLQLWQTGFDNLGLELKLVAGTDEYGEQRKAVRAYAKEFLGLDYEMVAGNVRQRKMLENLLPDTEWMLEPWRYGA